MWTLIWIVLVVAFCVVPAVMLVYIWKKAMEMLRGISQTITHVATAHSADEAVSIRPVAQQVYLPDTTRIQQARAIRHYVSQSRTYRKQRRLLWAMTRWNALGLTHTSPQHLHIHLDKPQAPEVDNTLVPPARETTYTW